MLFAPWQYALNKLNQNPYYKVQVTTQVEKKEKAESQKKGIPYGR